MPREEEARQEAIILATNSTGMASSIHCQTAGPAAAGKINVSPRMKQTTCAQAADVGRAEMRRCGHCRDMGYGIWGWDVGHGLWVWVFKGVVMAIKWRGKKSEREEGLYWV